MVDSAVITRLIRQALEAELRREDQIARVALAAGHGYAVIQSPYHMDYVLLPQHQIVERLHFPHGWDSFNAWRERQPWSG